MEGRRPKLLIHSCCAPCSSYVLEYLSGFFDITIFYYNPNIHPEDEYIRRVEEQQQLIKAMPLKSEVHFIQGEYRPKDYYDKVKAVAKLKNVDNVFVVDAAAGEELRDLWLAENPEEHFLSNEIINQIAIERASTMIHINDYTGNFKKPVVIIDRFLGADEIIVTEQQPKYE